MDKTLTSFYNNRIFQHVLFWVSYVLVFGLLYGKYGDNYFYYFKESLYMLPFVVMAAYIILYAILPVYLKKKNLLVIVFGSFLTLMAAVLCQRITLRVINDLNIEFEKLFDLTFLYMFLETSFMVGIALVIKLMKKSMKHQQEKHEIEKQNLKAELKLLKAQIQPHFLFNTMNNLYALSLDRSVKTSEGIAKISDLLSIILYECNEAVIPLDKEVSLLNNYIDLEKLRYGDRLDISFEVAGDTRQKYIAPMLLITFIENCFKHGCSLDPGSPWIKLKLETADDKLFFRVENSKHKTMKNLEPRKDGGIGIENVKRRLDLLYKDKHKLLIKDDDDRFLVELVLDLRENV